MGDYWGSGKAAQRMLPLIAVPTTAGTGSEVQSCALIERSSDHPRMACGDPKAAPRDAVLDPDLTASMPRQVAAFTGLDALTHAVEAAVTKESNAVSSLFAGEAFRLGVSALPGVLAGDADVAVRADMLLAATFAGLAIESSMLGAAHSMANPLTARYHLHHGQTVGVAGETQGRAGAMTRSPSRSPRARSGPPCVRNRRGPSVSSRARPWTRR